MGAAAGGVAAVSAVSTILDDLVTAFKTVFNYIYRFAKPGWVITFAAGAPIALQLIDNGITIALSVVAQWAQAIWTTAANVYEGVYNWVCNKLGGCGLFNVLQSVAATIAAAVTSAPIWLAAVMMQYVVQPLASFILNALKQVFAAVYQFVCTVLVPVVKWAIAAYVDYHAVKRVYAHMHDTIASWFSSWTPREMLKAIGKTVATFAAPLASGFIASYMYDYILRTVGACGIGVTIQMPGAPGVPSISATTTFTQTLTVVETLLAAVLPSGAAKTLAQYVVATAESLAAKLTSGLAYTWPIGVTETLAAVLKAAVMLEYTFSVSESLTAILKTVIVTQLMLSVTETLAAVLKAYGAFIRTVEQAWYIFSPLAVVVATSEKYGPGIAVLVPSSERYGSGIQYSVTIKESYVLNLGIGYSVTTRESYSITAK